MSAFDAVPDNLLGQEGTKGLRNWLRNRGLTMSLADLEDVRRRRGIVHPMRKHTRNDRTR